MSASTETHRYAILQETNGEECESWLYFIKWDGNEENIRHLEKQLDDVEWYVVDDLSTFDLETKFLVSEQTAKEMTMVDLNSRSFHRMFSGTLKRIDLGFKPKYSNEKKMAKAFDVLGMGQIANFIDQEYVAEEHNNSSSRSESASSEETEDKEDSSTEEKE